MSLLFIFDMDDVLYGYDWTARSEALGVLTGLRSEELQNLWWRQGRELEAESGLHPSTLRRGSRPSTPRSALTSANPTGCRSAATP